MKFKNFIAAVCAFSLLLAPSVSFAKSIELTLGSNDIYVNDGTIEKKTVEVAPFTENGRTLVPFRAIFEAMGCAVYYSEADGKPDRKPASCEQKDRFQAQRFFIGQLLYDLGLLPFSDTEAVGAGAAHTAR